MLRSPVEIAADSGRSACAPVLALNDRFQGEKQTFGAIEKMSCGLISAGDEKMFDLIWVELWDNDHEGEPRVVLV